MGKSRLNDLRANLGRFSSLRDKGQHQSNFLEDFLKRFESEVTSSITEIKANIRDVHILQLKVLKSVNLEQTVEAEKKLQDLCEQNKRLALKVQNALQNEKTKLVERKSTQLSPIQKDDDKERYIKEVETRRYELELRQKMIQTEAKRFLDVWQQYNDERLKFRKQSKDIVIQKCKIVNPAYTDSQIEEMLDEGTTDVFNDSILARTEITRRQIVDLRERHQSLLELEQSLFQLNEMYLEFGRLVENQGEMVDNIFENVESAVKNLEEANENVSSAKKLQRSVLKKKLMTGTLVLLALFIVLIIILAIAGVFSG